MEFIPICLECDNFKNRNKCPHYVEIPFEIKNRERRCDLYSGEEMDYVLYSKDAYGRDRNGVQS